MDTKKKKLFSFKAEVTVVVNVQVEGVDLADARECLGMGIWLRVDPIETAEFISATEKDVMEWPVR